jgi:O-antigen/teichoic acid export membrane protein
MAASRFMLAAILARRLTQVAFGRYAYGQWLVDISFLLCSLGATSAVSRYMAEYSHDPGLLSSFIRRWQFLAVGLPFLAAIGVLFGSWLSGTEITPLGAAMLASWTLASGFWAMQTAALAGMQRSDLIFKANAVAALIMLSGAFVLPKGGDPAPVFGLMALACLAGSTIGLVVTRGLIHGVAASSREIDWRGIRVYALNMWVSALIASLVWSRGELPLVKAMLGDAAVAQYAAALAIYGATVQAIMLGLGGVGPHLTSLWGKGKKREAVILGRNIMDLQLAIGGMGSLAVIFFGPEIISFAFSATYRGAAAPLSILCIGLVSFAVSCQSLLLQLETNAKFSRNVLLFGLAVLFAMAFVLIPLFGISGAACARIGALLAVSTATAYFATRLWGRSAISLGNVVIVAGVLSLALLLQDELGHESIQAKFSTFALGVAMLATLLRSSDGRLLVRSVYRRLSNRFA